MKCPKCGAENRYNSLICNECGASLLDLFDAASVDYPETDSSPAQEVQQPEFPRRESAPSGRRVLFIDEPEPEKFPEPVADDRSSEDYAEAEDNDFSEKLREFLKKAGEFFVSAGTRLWAGIKLVCGKIRGWFMNAVDFTEQKVRERSGTSGDNDQDGGTLRKIIIAVMLAVILLILFIITSSCGACATCGSCSCAPETLAGTWVEYNSTLDGYDAADTILELTSDGTVMQYGIEVGSYGYSDGQLTLVFNGMTFIGYPQPSDDYIDIYLNGSNYAGQRIIKLSPDTGLSSEKLASLYPEAD